MSERTARHLRAALYTAGVIAAAMLCRRVAYVTDSGFLDKLANYTRVCLYIGLFAVWGVSVHRRVMQHQVRRWLVAVSALLVLWMILREFRWHLVQNPVLLRLLWYSYHIFTLLIPLLALLVSLSLGKPEDYRLPKRALALVPPTAGLILLVMTNDLHQCVFRFPNHAAVWGETDYSYAPGFYILLGWGVACAVAAFAIMLSKCRLPHTRRFLWLPLLPFGAALLYIILYALRLPFAVHTLGDVAVLNGLLFTAFFESCIQSGLIQSNSRYFELFRACGDISAQIVDVDYTVRYAAEGAAALTREDMERAAAAAVILPNGKRLHNMPVRGGRAIWTEDISELLALREAPEERRAELRERNDFLRCEYEKEREHRLAVEQNRLYDLLQNKTQSQLDRIRDLANSYQQAENEDEKRRIIARIVVLGSYVKRRKDFVLSMDTAANLPEAKLSSAFGESFRSLALLGIQGGWLVRTGRDYLPGELLTQAYDFFESVVESIPEAARYLSVRVGVFNGSLRIAVTVDRSADERALFAQFPNARADRDGDGAEYLLTLEGGVSA